MKSEAQEMRDFYFDNQTAKIERIPYYVGGNNERNPRKGVRLYKDTPSTVALQIFGLRANTRSYGIANLKCSELRELIDAAKYLIEYLPEDKPEESKPETSEYLDPVSSQSESLFNKREQEFAKLDDKAKYEHLKFVLGYYLDGGDHFDIFKALTDMEKEIRG